MSFEAYESRSDHPETWDHLVQLVGVTSSVAKSLGRGVTASRTSTGVYKLVFASNPGIAMLATATLRATTMTALAGFTVVFGAYDATNFAQSLTVFNASATATDLAALQWVDLVLSFKNAAKGV